MPEDREDSFLKDVGKDLAREFGVSLRWAAAGAIGGALLLGVIGFFVAGLTGLGVGAGIGAISGGAALWFFHLSI
jgi:hypothetical protein